MDINTEKYKVTNNNIKVIMNIEDIISTQSAPNGTTPTCNYGNGTPMYWGFISAGIAVLGYGTSVIPLKTFHTGDGLFFQWILGISTCLYGLVIQQIRDNPQFYMLPMLGGFLFITGNVTVVPQVKLIGMGLCSAISGITSLLSGWATGRFGLFGLEKDPPDNLLLNDVGVILAVFSVVIFALVKSEVSLSGIDKTVTITVNSTEKQPLIPNVNGDSDSLQTIIEEVNAENIAVENSIQKHNKMSVNNDLTDLVRTADDDNSFIDGLSPTIKRVTGIILALCSGLFYGQTFTPYLYVQTYYEGSSKNALDYVFSTLCGGAATSTVYFLIYAAYKQNRPKVYPRAIIPAFVTGLLWTIATSCWFVANLTLSEAVAFPIIATGPTVVANLVGVFIFKEIKGTRNLLILTCGMIITLTGALLTGFSKKSTQC